MYSEYIMNIRELEASSTAELIEFVQGKEHYLEAAECAFRNLFLRYEDELTKKCRRIATKWGFDKETGDILAEQSLDRFWTKPHTFKAENCTVKDINRCLLFYLFSMARNALADRQRDISSGRTYYKGDEELIIDFPDHSDAELSAEKLKEIRIRYDLIDKALARLSYKHKVIYLTYLTHGHNKLNLPRKLLLQLREELDLDQNSIRVYKMQAIKEVKQYLEIYDK